MKNKARQTTRYYSDKGYTVLAQDESSHILGWNVMNGWYEKGRPISTPISLSKERFYSFGALSEDEFLCVFYDKANRDTFSYFLYMLQEEFGKGTVVCRPYIIPQVKVGQGNSAKTQKE